MPRKAMTSKKRATSSKRVKFSKSKSSNSTGKGAYSVKKSGGPLEELARALGRKLGSWTGTGDYVSPDIVPENRTVLAPDPPRFDQQKDGVVITHREYLGDIISSATPGAFKVQKFGLNPSDSATFPWMSQIAQPNFQQYKFEQMIFEFRTFSSDALNSTNTALGSVFSCINYDYNDPDVNSRAEVENTDWSNSTKPSNSMLIPVECDPKQTGLNQGLLYVINGNNVPAGADPKTYYMGKLFIGTVGLQGANVNIGSLYVTYKLKLYKPLMSRPLSNALITTFARTGATTGVLWGTANTSNVRNSDSIGVTISGNVLTMNKSRLQVGQNFRLLYTVTGGSVAGATPSSVAISSNAIGLNAWSIVPGGTGFDNAVINSPPVPATSTLISLEVWFRVLDNNSDVTITLSGGVYPTGPNISCLQISQMCGIPFEQIGIYQP